MSAIRLKPPSPCHAPRRELPGLSPGCRSPWGAAVRWLRCNVTLRCGRMLRCGSCGAEG